MVHPEPSGVFLAHSIALWFIFDEIWRCKGGLGDHLDCLCVCFALWQHTFGVFVYISTKVGIWRLTVLKSKYVSPGPNWDNGPKWDPGPSGQVDPTGSQGQLGQWAQRVLGPIGPMGPDGSRAQSGQWAVCTSTYTYLYKDTFSTMMHAYLYKGYLCTSMNACILNLIPLSSK